MAYLLEGSFWSVREKSLYVSDSSFSFFRSAAWGAISEGNHEIGLEMRRVAKCQLVLSPITA